MKHHIFFLHALWFSSSSAWTESTTKDYAVNYSVAATPAVLSWLVGEPQGRTEEEVLFKDASAFSPPLQQPQDSASLIISVL